MICFVVRFIYSLEYKQGYTLQSSLAKIKLPFNLFLTHPPSFLFGIVLLVHRKQMK
ncbi:hypothetical protein EMIT079MI2_120069 [Bacillus sp. IT-79MI2]|nr:hypothetical protein BTH41_00869 [Bacillus mycoides]